MTARDDDWHDTGTGVRWRERTSIHRLVATKGFAQMVGVKPDTISRYGALGILPAPIAYVGNIPLWTRSQVKAWIKDHPSTYQPRRSA